MAKTKKEEGRKSETHAETEKGLSKKRQNVLIRNTIIFLGVIMAAFVLFFAVMNSFNSFKYNGVDFQINKEAVKGATLYQTSVPVIYQGQNMTYNFYLREDPRELEAMVPVNGSIDFRKNMILDVTTENLYCNGDWNYFQLQLSKVGIFDVKLSAKNDSVKYEPSQDYMFMTINEGNKTGINQIDGNHYEINISNCEDAAAADRILLEAIVKYYEMRGK
jgi:hypothetical protein